MRFIPNSHECRRFSHRALVHRFRPPNSIEKREGSEIVVSFDENLQTARMKSAAAGERDGFTFDRVFPMATQQNEVFDYGVKECVVITSGCNVCH